ncbi:MAG: phosphatidate cytidylyltransferase, partial [Victivallales bacterium]|nr:phosphatidate cytidylyltransferase [Victivallales bacterium]
LVILLALIFICPGYYGKGLFTLLAVVMLSGSIHEGHTLLGGKSRDAYEIILWLVGLGLIAAPWYPLLAEKEMLGIAYAAPSPHSVMAIDAAIGVAAMLAAFCVTLKNGSSKEEMARLGAFTLTGVYVAWSLSFLVKLFFLPSGALLLGYLAVITKMADIGAYFVGTGTSRLPGGNHKLAPAISPKKSWEGLIGGAVFAIAASIIFRAIAHANGAEFISLGWAITMGVLSPIVGLIGDLAESALKRAANAKDSGRIIGLGGLLDMLDSLIPMGIIFYAKVILFS